MRDLPLSAGFAAFIDALTRVDRGNGGSRCRKLRLTRAESKRRSMAGMRARDEINRHNALAYVDEDPLRREAFHRANNR